MTRGHARMQVMMEMKIGSNANSNTSASESSQSFVVRMWQEDPGEWRGTVRHVQSNTQLGFTRLEQVRAFIQRYTSGSSTHQAEKQSAVRPTFHLDLGMSRRTTRMIAFAFALIIMAVVGLLAVSQGNVGQLLGFGH
jgi:hypothetical protein